MPAASISNPNSTSLHPGRIGPVVRPDGFMQTLIVAMARTIRERGIIANPLGTAGISLIDCADAGPATAAVLTDPARDGHRYVLTGPSAPTYPRDRRGYRGGDGRSCSGRGRHARAGRPGGPR